VIPFLTRTGHNDGTSIYRLLCRYGVVHVSRVRDRRQISVILFFSCVFFLLFLFLHNLTGAKRAWCGILGSSFIGVCISLLGSSVWIITREEWETIMYNQLQCAFLFLQILACTTIDITLTHSKLKHNILMACSISQILFFTVDLSLSGTRIPGSIDLPAFSQGSGSPPTV